MTAKERLRLQETTRPPLTSRLRTNWSALTNAGAVREPIVKENAFRIDFAIWHARLEGWQPLGTYLASYPTRSPRRAKKVSKSA